MLSNPSKWFATTLLSKMICFLVRGREDWWTRHPVVQPWRSAQDVHSLPTLWLWNLDSCGFIMFCFDWWPFVASLLIPMESHISLGWSYWMPQDVCLIFRFYSMISDAVALVSVHFCENNNGATLKSGWGCTLDSCGNDSYMHLE